MFKVLQVSLSEMDCMVINSMGWEAASEKFPKVNAYMLSTVKREFQEAFNTGEFKHVATIDASDLNEVFDIGNIGPEEKITRHAPMHSVSVGDVIEDPAGALFVVASFGFEPITQ